MNIKITVFSEMFSTKIFKVKKETKPTEKKVQKCQL